MSRIAILGAGAGGLSAAVQLSQAGHTCALWNRGEVALADIVARGGFSFSGVLGEGEERPALVTFDLQRALAGADAALVVVPTLAHASIARGLHRAGWTGPVILNPGHTGGALAFRAVYEALGATLPPLAEFSTLTYVARKLDTLRVYTSGVAKSVRVAAFPGGEIAANIGKELFPCADLVPDVLFSSLSNVNLVLHPPGAILGASWVEATGGDFTFYREGMTEGVVRIMERLDDERRSVARAYGHELPTLVEEMVRIGTVEEADRGKSTREAISGGVANSRIRAPDSLGHRYYVEDFGHGLLPFLALARCARVETPIACALMEIARGLIGDSLIHEGRGALDLGIAGMGRDQVLGIVRGHP